VINHGDRTEQIWRNDNTHEYQHKCIITMAILLAPTIIHASLTVFPLFHINAVGLSNEILTFLGAFRSRCGIRDRESE
jgi:hypothetical protein